MEQKEQTQKNPVGRPKTSTMKSYHYKAEGDLIPLLDNVENRNGFINAAVREKAEREGLLK